jgi:hypothetical protein
VRLRVLLVDDGLDGVAGPVATVLRDAGLGTVTVARQELATVSPADVVIPAGSWPSIPIQTPTIASAY